jgi:hypothetical protein
MTDAKAVAVCTGYGNVHPDGFFYCEVCTDFKPVAAPQTKPMSRCEGYGNPHPTNVDSYPYCTYCTVFVPPGWTWDIATQSLLKDGSNKPKTAPPT